MARVRINFLSFRFLAAILFFTRAAHATDFDPVEIGKWPPYPAGTIAHFAISGNFAYGTMGRQGLIVLDISDPVNPQRVGGCDTPGLARDVAPKENVLFIADPWRAEAGVDPAAGLLIVDVADKTSPRIVRNFSNLNARGVFLASNLLYVVAANKLHVLDITQPFDPQLLGECEINGPTGLWQNPKLALRENILCIANNLAGIEIIDVANPTAPRRLATEDTPAEARAVALSGNYAYVADNEGGILIFDLAIPQSPQRVGHIPSTGWTPSLALYDRFLIAGDTATGLRFFDLENPIAPTLRSEFRMNLPHNLLAVGSRLYAAEDGSGFIIFDLTTAPVTARLGEFRMTGYSSDVKVFGDHAFVADSSRLEIIDIRDPRQMTSVGRWRAPAPSSITTVAVRSTFAFLGGDGVTVLDISRPNQPAFVSQASVDGHVGGLQFAGSFLLVEKGYAAPSSIAVLNIADPASPVRVEWPALADYDRVVAVAGRYAYLSSSAANKLAVLDLDASPPAIVGFYEEPGAPNSPWRGVRRGDFLYVNERAFDVSDPANPRLADRFPSSPWQIISDGDYLYGAAGQFVHKYDLNNPPSPRLIGVSKTSTYELFSRVDVKENVLFSVSPQGLHAFDITKPANPQRAATIPQRSSETVVFENLAYVAQNGLAIFDISDPSQPVELSRTGSGITALALYGSHVYATGYAQGIKVIDISVPSAPRILKTLRPGSSFYDLALSGARLCAGSEILRVFDLSQPSDPVEVGAFQTQSISEMIISGGKAYIVSDPGRFEILDVSNPAAIRVLYRSTGPFVLSAAISGNYLFLSQSEYFNRAWLATFDITDPSQPIPVARLSIYSSRAMTIDGNLLYSYGDGFELFDISDPANIKLVGRNGNVHPDHIHRAGDWIYLSSYNGWHILHSFAQGQNDSLRFENLSLFPSWSAHLVGLPGIDIQVDQSPDLLNWQNLTSFSLPRGGKTLSPQSTPSANMYLRARVR